MTNKLIKQPYNPDQLNELLYQALETERGGVKVYKTALSCAQDDSLKREWQGYLEQTQNHVQILKNLITELGLNPEQASPGRDVVAHIGESLVTAMIIAKSHGTAEAAQLVAGECVVLAETKDHQNWELIGHLAEHCLGEHTLALKTAFDLVGQEEQHHLYHTKGYVRELWLQALGLPAVLPPPEEVKKVGTAIGAARAEQQRGAMLQPQS